MNMHNIFIYLIFIFISSCASVVSENNLTGIYKVSSRNCVGSQYEKEACMEVKLLEIVKGNFYKIQDSENAFVIWSGESDLNYNARKLEQNIEDVTYPIELTIDRDDVYLEKLIFRSSAEGEYVTGKANNFSTLFFKKVGQEDITDYSKEYPGNN